MCCARDRHHLARTAVRAPVPPEPWEVDRDLLASDAERERAVEALRKHAGEGRLDAEELEQRIGLAFAARTRADLAELLRDLPQERRSQPARARAPSPDRAHHRRGEPAPFVPIAVLLVTIWAVTGAGYFWPIWPLLFFAFASLCSRRSAGNPRVIR